MTTFQDQPPQSRRALRQERPATEEIDDSAAAVRAPSGRRARAADAEATSEVPVDAPHVSEMPNATEVAHSDEPVDAHSDDEPVVTDSAVPKAFPFAGQVEATNDDAGHPGFRLRDFSPELSTSRADAQSSHDWTPGRSGAAAIDEPVPLDYQTQGGPAFGYVSPYSEPAPVASESESTAAVGEADDAEPSFDSLFSDLLAPEAAVDENSAGAVNSSDAAPDAESVDAHEADAATPVVPVGEPIAVAEPVAPVEPVVVAQEERTLSRREWRAMRAKAEAEAEEAAATSAPFVDAATETPAVETAPEPASDMDVLFQQPEVADDGIPPLVEPEAAPQTALSDAMAEFEALTRGGQTTAEPVASPFPSLFAEPVPPAAFVAPAPVTPVPVVPAPAEPENVQPEAAAPEAAAPETAAPEAPVAEAPAADTPAAETQPEAAAPREPFSFLLSPSAAPAAEQTDPEAYTPPVGHWSRQAQMDDESQPFENTLSRDVGGGNVATTTNALVLPMIPQRDDFSSVLNATGEIMVTGTINLPGSVGSTGRDSRHYDDPEVDHLFDAFDTEIASTDSAPVRAITAVSSHTATRSGIESGRKQSNRMLNVLLVTACVMAAAVAGLLIAGFVFKIF